MKIVFVTAILSSLLATNVAIAGSNTVVYEGTVKVTNTAPSPDGVRVTPVWVGVHNGQFDTYDGDVAAFPGIEPLAEDGNTGPLSAEFLGTDGAVWDATIGAAPLAPGEMAEIPFVITATVGEPLYISYASMILPSNDFWVSNGNPMQYKIIDESGAFIGTQIDVMGTDVLDAGTEVNDEEAANVPLLGQEMPNTGGDEGGVVTSASGFIPDGPILTAFPGADFTADGYSVMKIEVMTIQPKTINGRVRVTNLAPEFGTFLTPFWAAIHDGTFDTYNRGEAVRESVERLAEDGNNAPLMDEFAQTDGGLWDGTVGTGPISPGTTVELPFEITIMPGNEYFFSYASMIIPSNDFWIANGDPMAYMMVDAEGNFIGQDITVLGSAVLDAGTETNTESEESTAFFGQSAPNTGTDEGGVVTDASGFIPDGPILTSEMFANADFTVEGYQVARIEVVMDVPKTVRAQVIITNLAPTSGTFQTPVWAGIHDGSFDLYNRGESLPNFLEPLVEDGATGSLVDAFGMSSGSVWDGVLGSGPISPGETEFLLFDLTYTPGKKLYFSYASMIIPSNDAWIGNGDPMAYEIVDESGNFLGTEFVVLGTDVLDGGTEINDEVPEHTAFFGQSEPNTGVDENGFVEAHPGFIENGPILSDPMFANANFLAPGYQVLSVKVVEVVEEPDIEFNSGGTRFLRGRRSM